MPSKTIEDFAYQIKDYMRSAEVVKGKNYLYNNAPTTSTSHHINFTKNADLTITANGNNTDETAAWVKINENVSLPNNDYVLSGGKSATKNISFTIGGTVYNDIGNGVQFTINNTVIPEIILYIKGEVDNEVFSPMICTLDEWNKSHDYEPYYVPVKDSKFDIADQQVLGAWNLLKYPYYNTTKSVSGLDYTDLGDGSVEADGTSTVSNNDFTCLSRGIMNYELEAGTYYVSGCPEGGSESTYHLRISKNKVYNNPSQGFDDLGIDTGDGFSFTLTEKSQLNVAIRIGQTSINHLIFKPMISLEPNQPYVPYAMTNRELTEVVEHTLTPNSKLNVSDVKCISCGRIHSLTFLATATQSIGQDESLFTGTIPYGSTPYYFFKTTYGDKMCEIQNGKIVIKSSAAANDVIRGSVTWIY